MKSQWIACVAAFSAALRFDIAVLWIIINVTNKKVRYTRNRCACMIRCMNVDDARVGIYAKDRSRWRSVVSAYTHGKKA